jgi:two-component system NtrC family sensor kinase
MSDFAGTPVRTRHSVRYRLLAIALLPMLVILPIFLGVAMYRWNARFDAMLLAKADGDLTIADQYMEQILDGMETSLQSLGASARFRDAMGRDPRSTEGLGALLEQEAQEKHYDFLYIVDAKNEIVASNVPLRPAAVRSDRPLLKVALAGKAMTGIDLFSASDLQAISPKLAETAQIKLVSTDKAAPTTRSVETRGMVVHSAAPIRLPDGAPAALVSGTLLNRNLRFVDTINSLVYHDASLPEGSAGTASLLLDDVRISTNVRLFENHRAIGTRVSSAVRTAVLDQGRNWLDSAFVVNDWYVSAYRPVEDTSGRRIGMLYVGFLEKPFTAMRREIVLSISFAFLLVTGLTVPLFLKWATDIFRPLERMTATISKVEQGDLAARTGHADGNDEIGQVAQHLDHLLAQVQDRDLQLREWNSELNRRVEERTEHLVRARQQIEDTTKQLVMAEKLATIGEITAGVAHEINNPLAVMQGNLEIIRDVMGERAADAQFEFQLLDEQIQRIGDIIRKLLQFAKPAEYAGYEELHPLPQIVSETMPLVEHLLKKTAIAVERDDSATHPVSMNRTELQQVLVNLMVNAVHAMPEGGTLLLRTFDQAHEDGRDGSAVAVTDTGTGMTADVVSRIFDPFFTTKQREGNGLGLAICQMLVLQAGGTLSVESIPGSGSTFLVWLPDGAQAREEGQSV